ncbi:NADH-cytochrome b5 reductase-like protein [Arachis duranensis]|uniref:NADH-cytochrome b5 reductase n=1 Tax=Arachis duranensis TaxID=130453 RepID=A0A9C6TJM9_ARADU|nr:NADH-cytochrome b5 reductase-like protein [Arachis duranensis]
MEVLLKRFLRATPIAFANAFNAQSKSSSSSSSYSSAKFRLPYAAVAAGVSGGLSCFYFLSSPNLVHSEQAEEGEIKNIALNPDKWVEFKLQDTARVSHNTQLFRFSFDPTKKLGLDIASCILTRAPLGQDAEGKPKYVIFRYTPISDPEAKGYFDLLIKVYPEGKMSQHFASLKPGDVVEVKGPIEKLRYTPNMKKHIGMVAGGSGITPMLQVIEAILKNPDDKTKISLLYANVSPDDILLKQKLDVLAATHPNLKIFYTVDNPTKNWRGGSGLISEDMVVKGLPAPADDTLILVCGPPGMMKHVSGEKAKDWTQGEVSGLLKEAGYTEQMVYKF